jgi:phage baseplate assembly protein gpV
MYTPPSTPPAVPQNTPTLAATSVKDPTKSDLDGLTITAALPLSVTITNKFTTIQAGGTAIPLTAQVQNDASNSGVAWTLTAAGSACSPDCGSLSGVTTTSATYTPPNATPQSPANQPLITATSVKDNNQSDTDQFTINASAVAVTIINKANAVTAGSGSITLTARVTNDPSNSGVRWSLTGNGGTNCVPACGTLGTKTATTVVYNPPATALASPDNLANIAANSVRDGTRSDLDSFTVISGTVSSCAGTPTGHESLLSGQYAFFAQGVSVMAGSFSSDGNGHFTDLGGGVAGSLDINTEGNPQTITLVASNAGNGLYTVGPDPAGAGEIGCLSLYGADGSSRIFRFSLGRVNGGVAQAGRITEYDDQAGDAVGAASRVSGPLLRQDPGAFSSGDTSHLQSNYAFGLTGALGSQASVAGALVLSPSSGAITNSDFDSYETGVTSAVVQGDVQGSTGSIASVSQLTGRALFSLTPMARISGREATHRPKPQSTLSIPTSFSWCPSIYPRSRFRLGRLHGFTPAGPSRPGQRSA